MNYILNQISNLLQRLLLWLKRKIEHAPKEPESIQVIIPREEMYQMWDKMYFDKDPDKEIEPKNKEPV